jgi:cyclic pyranopterin phosphate synthase
VTLSDKIYNIHIDQFFIGNDMTKLSHVNENGAAHMVDISDKVPSKRVAIATAMVQTTAEVIRQIQENTNKKGDVLSTARIAGIMAAKQTSNLIPLCHPLSIDAVTVTFEVNSKTIRITSQVTTTGKTGVEMEALSAVSIAALTVYDMCKAVDKKMVITHIQLEEKTGGKSGPFKR